MAKHIGLCLRSQPSSWQQVEYNLRDTSLQLDGTLRITLTPTHSLSPNVAIIVSLTQVWSRTVNRDIYACLGGMIGA